MFKSIGGILVNFAQSNADLAPLIGVENGGSNKGEFAQARSEEQEIEVQLNGKHATEPFEGGKEESQNSTLALPRPHAPN